MIFWSNPNGKSTKKVRFGLSENERFFCLIKLHEKEIVVEWLTKPCNICDTSITSETVIVRPVPFHYIWRKYLFFPLEYSEQTVYRRIIRILRQELPLPLEDVYFDYVVQPLIEEGVLRVIVHVLRKSYADPLSMNKNTVLDCEIYCFARGFEYLRTDKKTEASFDTYTVKGKSFRFTLSALEINGGENIREDFSCLNLPQNVLDPYLYVTALGACLWNGKASI